MSLSILLSLSVCVLAPQDTPAAAQPAPVLAKADQDTLRARVMEYYKARIANRDAEEGRKEAARKKEEAAKDKLKKEWATKSGKKDVLASVADLRAIFANVFEYERQSGSGDMRTVKTKGFPNYDLVLSKKYKSDVAMPTALLMRGRDDKGWVGPGEWYGTTWKASVDAADFAFVLPALDPSVDFDPPVDLATPQGEVADAARREAVLAALGAARQTVNVDRDRLFFDCGKGSCAYALRQATYAPHLFAGLVLRHPTEPGDLRLDSLGGVPVLLLQTAETKDVCERLAAALNKVQAGTATVLEAKGAYPHADSAADIAAWMRGHPRDLLRPHVVFANTHDSLRRAFWVLMGTAESLQEVPPAAQPRIEVVADRASNKITVTSRGVSDFTLLLNDTFVDLDKEITTIINGKAQPPLKLERSLLKLLDSVFNYGDTGMLITTEKTFVVPVEKAEKPKDQKGESPTPK